MASYWFDTQSIDLLVLSVDIGLLVKQQLNNVLVTLFWCDTQCIAILSDFCVDVYASIKSGPELPFCDLVLMRDILHCHTLWLCVLTPTPRSSSTWTTSLWPSPDAANSALPYHSSWELILALQLGSGRTTSLWPRADTAQTAFLYLPLCASTSAPQSISN